MKNEKCTENAKAGCTCRNHTIAVTPAALAAFPLSEIQSAIQTHQNEFDMLPYSVNGQQGDKMMIETTADGANTFVFLPAERTHFLQGRKMRDLTEENLFSSLEKCPVHPKGSTFPLVLC